MSNALSLEQSAVREVSSLFGNEKALKKIISFARKLKKELNEEAEGAL